ncbi:MAG: hypothetical protein UR29_C0012G0004 [Candidatus Woesebacteria bacterium GW2011_GWC2_33_12]|nr:MAG: hypothetical protein UR29_C0012G0004 [Candidatus Woesebacteria bacterium GW2011_GWC2_33_12]
MVKLFLNLIIFILFTPFASSVNAYDPSIVANNIYGMGIINHSDLEDVKNLVNVNGGDWGYVTVVITEKDRDIKIWQKFLDDCRKYHLIPIVRVATTFENGSWQIPEINEIDSWVNFFNSLNWVIENRYIVIANEPNHSKEWGGKIDPEGYALYLKTFAERLHNTNKDYFVLNAGFDQSASNSRITMDQKLFMQRMVKAVPNIFTFIDGWSSHSYPNPAFSGSEKAIGRKTIRGYEWELSLVKKNLPVFITETGWIRTIKNEELIAKKLRHAYEEVWSKNKQIVAVTPFILSYTQDPFYEFSWKNKDGSFFPIYNEIQGTNKTTGRPVQKITGEIVFNFINPLIFKGKDQKGFTIVKNTGQAVWNQSESHVINELNNEISVSNTKFNQIEPFNSGLVVYSLNTSEKNKVVDLKLGFYVRGEKIGDVFSGKIILRTNSNSISRLELGLPAHRFAVRLARPRGARLTHFSQRDFLLFGFAKLEK